MKKIILISVLILVLVLVGCENIDVSQLSDEDLERVSDKAVICDKPYIRVGMECCLDQDDNSICDKDETAKTFKKEGLTPTQVVRIFIENSNAKNADEYISNTQDSLNYLTGYVEESLSETLRYLSELKEIYNKFYNEFWKRCKVSTTIAICENAQKRSLDNFNRKFEGEANILSIKEKENDGKNAVVNVKYEEIFISKKETKVRDYLLKEENDGWKIYDNIRENGTKWSDHSLDEAKIKNNKALEENKKDYDKLLEQFDGMEKEDDSTPETLEITSGEATSNGLKFDVSLAQNGESITYKDWSGETLTSSAMEGMKLLRFFITVESVGDSKSFYTSSFIVMDEEGNTYNGVCPLDYYKVSCTNSDGLGSMYSPIKGQKESGLLNYQIPLDVDKAFLVYKFSKYDKKPTVLKFVFEDI